MTARIRSDILVTSLVRTINGAGGMATIRHHGHDVAGVIHLVFLGREQHSLYTERYGEDVLAWRHRISGTASDVDQAVEKDRRFDSDLWVIDVEGVADLAALPGILIDN